MGADCASPCARPRTEGSGAAQLAEIYAKLEEIEADKAPARFVAFPLPPPPLFRLSLLPAPAHSCLFPGRASVILAGLGFTPAMQQQPTR